MDNVSGEVMAQRVADWLNNFGADHKGFVQAMAREHRTLQQSFTQLCLRWLYQLASEESFDLRNAASVDAARKVVAALGPEGCYLPHI